MSLRKSFVIHNDSLDILTKLSNEQAGILFKAIAYYQENEKLPELDLLTEIAIAPFIKQFERDKEKWEKVVQRNKENGSMGGRPKTQKNPEKPSGLSKNPNEPKKPVNVNDNVNVNVNDNKKINKKEDEPIFDFSGFNEEENTSIKNWLQYKKERKDPYTPTGIQGLRSKLLELKKTHSIINAINHSMGNNWKGIFVESPNTKPPPKTSKLHDLTNKDYSIAF